MVTRKTSWCRAAAGVFLLGLAGCAGVPPEPGRTDIVAELETRGWPVAASPEPGSLQTAADAAALALARNPWLESAYAEIGVSYADVYAENGFGNPALSLARLSGDAMSERTVGIAASLADALAYPARRRTARDEVAALRHDMTAVALATAAEAQAAFYRLVASHQVVELRETNAHAASLSAQLARRYFEAGNISRRDLALQEAAASETRLDAMEAQSRAVSDRARLARVMGISSAELWSVPAELELPTVEDPPVEHLLELADTRRVELAAARDRVASAAARADVENWAGLLGDLRLGVERESEGDGVTRGPSIDWEVPLSSRGTARARVAAELRQRVAELEAKRFGVQNEVRLAHAALAGWREKVRVYRDILLPARARATAGAQQEASFMLIGTFELIESRRREYDAYQGYVEAIRDFWIARSDLARAVGESLPVPQPRPKAAPIRDAQHEHGGHHD